MAIRTRTSAILDALIAVIACLGVGSGAWWAPVEPNRRTLPGPISVTFSLPPSLKSIKPGETTYHWRNLIIFTHDKPGTLGFDSQFTRSADDRYCMLCSYPKPDKSRLIGRFRKFRQPLQRHVDIPGPMIGAVIAGVLAPRNGRHISGHRPVQVTA